jgi:hypothetical protein
MLKKSLARALVSITLMLSLLSPAWAQQALSISQLKEQIQKLLLVESDPNTPAEVRDLNRTFLAERRSELRDLIEKRLAALRKYRTTTQTNLSDNDLRVVDNSIAELEHDLQGLSDATKPAAPAANPQTVRARRSSAAPPATPSASGTEVSAPAGVAATAAEPEPAQAHVPAAPNGIEITDPAGGKKVGAEQIDVYFKVNDPQISAVEVSVTDKDGDPVGDPQTITVPRGKDNGRATVTLAVGKNDIKIANKSTDYKADISKTVSVTREGKPKAAASGGGGGDAGAMFSPGVQARSTSGKIAVAADRVDSNANKAYLRVHVDPSITGYDLSVFDKDPIANAAAAPLLNAQRPIRDRGGEEFSDEVALPATGDRWIRVRALKDDGVTPDDAAANTAVIKIPSAANVRLAVTTPPDAPEYDWGRVRGYFASGVMFSKERDNFSKSDIFLSFTLDKNYLKKDWGWFKDINTFFNARLEALPVTVPSPTTTPAAGATPTPTPTPCSSAECSSFISSQKAAVLEVGVYLPMYWHFMEWTREVPNIARGTRRTESNALFIAPMAKGGVATITGTPTTAESARFGGDDVFNFFSFGTRIGHFRTHPGNRNLAPELISWLDLSVGRWEHFEFQEPVLDAAGRTLKDSAGNDIKVRRRPWRYEARGSLRIPETPFMIGFEGNFGKGPDDLRFIFGTRFDIAKVLKTLKVADANDSLGRSTPPQ